MDADAALNVIFARIDAAIEAQFEKFLVKYERQRKDDAEAMAAFIIEMKDKYINTLTPPAELVVANRAGALLYEPTVLNLTFSPLLPLA